jgi:hypothetical protein
VVGTGLLLGQQRIGAEVGASMVLDLRQVLFDHVQRMPLAFSRARTPASSRAGSTTTSVVSPTWSWRT